MIQVNFLAQMPVFLLENTCSGTSKYKRAKGLAKYVRNHKVSLYWDFFHIFYYCWGKEYHLLSRGRIYIKRGCTLQMYIVMHFSLVVFTVYTNFQSERWRIL